MIRKNDFLRLKEDIGFCVGQKVRLTTNKGKKKVLTKEGIIEKTYPNLFTVKFDDAESSVSTYTYTDILTNTIEVIKCSDNINLQ